MDRFLVIFGALGVLFLYTLVLSFPVMLLWDWLMPTIFGLKEITWLQAWGLSLMCNFLFKPSHVRVTNND